MKITGNEPYFSKSAFATEFAIDSPSDGLTIRQQFAMAAMQGLYSDAELLEVHSKIANKIGKSHEYVIARCAVDMADALIAELNRTEAANV